MARVIRKTSPELADIVAAHNDLKLQVGAGALFHLDISEQTITAAASSDAPTSLVLCNNIIGVGRFHLADTLAHKVADATSWPAAGAAVDLASAQTAANLMKATYNTHRASTTYHYNADATNVIAAADASSQGTLDTLLNELKADINLHMASGSAGDALRLVDA
jgi:hypothetical protein